MALSKVNPNFLNVSQVGGRRNLIINGAMQVAQRGESSTATTGINVCDRWRVNGAFHSWTTTQNTLTSSDTPYAYGFRTSLKTENTSAGTNVSSYQLWRHQIEAQNVAQSGWDHTNPNSYLTLSFWVKSSLAGTYYYHIRTEDGTSQMYISSITLSSNVWKKVELTFPGNSNITVNNDNGSGLNLNWYVHLGTTYSNNSSSLETWLAYDGGAQTPDYSQDWGNTAGATWEMTGIQLEVGDTATPFEHRSYAEELLACQRYYVQSVPGSRSAPDQTNEMLFGRGESYVSWTYPVLMRATPTVITSYDVSAGAGHYTVASINNYTNGVVLRNGPNQYAMLTPSTNSGYNTKTGYNADAEF